jgi:Tol biopolymer transport system component
VLDQQFIEIDGMRPVGLSPDGKWLAASDFGMSELCVYDAASGEEQVCSSMEPLQSGLRLEDVVWSPDSTRLALAERSFVFFRDGDLWVMDALSGELTNVADDGYTGDYPLGSEGNGETFSFDIAPAWTPDGAHLTYSRSHWVGGEFQGNDLAMIPAGGGEPESLTMVSEGVPGVAYLGMEWTADGEHLYYSVLSPNADDPANGIYRYDRDDESTRQMLSPSPELGPPAVLQVNATDTHVLIRYPYAVGSFERDKPLYWLFGVGTGDVTPLDVPVPDDAGIGWIVAATFSPDGRSMLSATRNTQPDFQLWVTDLESGEQTLLVESLPGAMVMEYSLTLSWTASGRIFVPANIGSGTLLTVEAVDMPEVGTPIAGPVDQQPLQQRTGLG